MTEIERIHIKNKKLLRKMDGISSIVIFAISAFSGLLPPSHRLAVDLALQRVVWGWLRVAFGRRGTSEFGPCTVTAFPPFWMRDWG